MSEQVPCPECGEPNGRRKRPEEYVRADVLETWREIANGQKCLVSKLLDKHGIVVHGIDGEREDFLVRRMLEALDAALDARIERLVVGAQGHSVPCCKCGQVCDALAGDPDLWPLTLVPVWRECEAGVTEVHCTGCVQAMMAETRDVHRPCRDALAAADAEIVRALELSDLDRPIEFRRRSLSETARDAWRSAEAEIRAHEAAEVETLRVVLTAISRPGVDECGCSPEDECAQQMARAVLARVFK